MVFSQKIGKIEVNNNKIFSDEEIEEWAGLNEGQNFFNGILDSSYSRISQALTYNGYFNFSFEGSQIEFSSDSQQVNLILIVDEGQPTIVKNIFISSSDSLNIENYISSFDYLKGEIFNRYEVESIIGELLKNLENRGFQDLLKVHL